MTGSKQSRELLHSSSHSVAHLSLPSTHAACTGAVCLVNPLLAVGHEAGAPLLGDLPFQSILSAVPVETRHPDQVEFCKAI